MEGLPTCANCLSIARDAKTMGIDVDGPQNDKGLYGLIPLHKVSSISNDYIIDWRAFSDKFAQKRFGFMSQVSPDGKFVVTSIEVPGGLEKIDAPATEFYRLFDISAQLADKKQFDAAVLAWNKALVLAPGDPRRHNNLDSALAEAGRVDEALPEFEESVELNPDSDAAGVNLGLALAAKGGHLEQAIQQLNKGLELQHSASAQNGLGVALARAGRLEDAMVHTGQGGCPSAAGGRLPV
jgi:tetratricopeptide (TPR) repeat protein